MDITITGHASTSLAPGLAEVHLSVEASGRDRTDVLTDVQRRVGVLLADLEALPKETLERFVTDGVSTWTARGDRRVTHHASCAVRARFVDFSRMAELTSAWAQQGVEVGHVAWRLTPAQREEALAGLVAEALDAAHAKARLIAQHLGVESLSVERVTDSSGEHFAPAKLRAMAFAGGAEAAPVDARPDDIELTTELTVVFTAR